MTAPTIDLPETALVDGRELTTHVARPCWVYAWTTTEADGNAWWSVYKTVLMRDSDDMFQPVRERIGDAQLMSRKTVSDPEMMFGQAELSTYAVAA